MLRTVAGVVAGLIVWIVVAMIVNIAFRAQWPGYAEVESAMHFTLAMMLGRLLLGALSSLFAGFTAAWITKGNGRAVKVLGVLLTVVFIPIHFGVWDKFPLWYHLAFLVSLFPLTLVGARLFKPGSVDRQRATT
jgi:hypothetical protein